MNKYQEALNKIENDIKYINNTRIWDEIPNAFETSLEDVKVMQEAVNKASKYDEKETTKELKKVCYKETTHYNCPNCGKTHAILIIGTYENEFKKGSNFNNYCSDCGQKLDWGEEE